MAKLQDQLKDHSNPNGRGSRVTWPPPLNGPGSVSRWVLSDIERQGLSYPFGRQVIGQQEAVEAVSRAIGVTGPAR